MRKRVIGLYLRLSDEEIHEYQSESNSIQSQREILNDYVQSHAEFQNDQIIEYCDDGYSGVHFNRPGVQKMLEQVREGIVSVIVVKDFSRFGRNYIEVGNYLEQVFPFLGIRFISVNDGFDSGISDLSKEFFDVAFKNLAHDLYSRDLSEKIVSVRRMKAGQGKFITSYAPYGYQKSLEQRLIPDRETAPIVRRIFHMAAKGIPKAHIAKTLNKEGVPSPLMLRRQRGEHFPCRTVNEKSVWKTQAVFTILKDQRYVGDTVYGKVRRTTAGSKKDYGVPKEQWIIVPDTHEAIVTREVFEKVNRKMQTHNICHRGETAPLMGKVRCAGCLRIISRVKRTRSNGEKGATYRCKMQNMTKEFGCCPKTIEERRLESVILTILQKAAAVVADEGLVETARNSLIDRAAEAERLLSGYEKETAFLTGQRLEKYEAYKDDRLSREDFIKEKTALEERIRTLLSKAETYRQKLYDIKRTAKEEPDKILQQGLFALFESLTREAVETFVGQVYICRDGSLRIEWKFRDFSK